MYDVDLKLLYEALNYYKLCGYEMISAPLLVDKDIVEITLPSNKVAKEHLGLFYVGSAEQSFYQLMKNGDSIISKYSKFMMLTPCQRDEVLDGEHLEIFLKLELISFKGDTIGDVYNFYKSKGFLVEKEKTEDGEDLFINNLEVGSFGNRFFINKLVHFGTGLALPRISQAFKLGDK